MFCVLTLIATSPNHNISIVINIKQYFITVDYITLAQSQTRGSRCPSFVFHTYSYTWSQLILCCFVFRTGWIKWNMHALALFQQKHKQHGIWFSIFYFYVKTFIIRGLYEKNLFILLVFIRKYCTVSIHL